MDYNSEWKLKAQATIGGMGWQGEAERAFRSKKVGTRGG